MKSLFNFVASSSRQKSVGHPNRSTPRLHRSSITSPALLALTGVLNALASRVGSVLDASGDALKTITDRLGAGSVVDSLADATTSCANKATGGLGDTTQGVSDLLMCQMYGMILVVGLYLL